MRMPNSIAYAALIVWPFVTLALFALMQPGRALIWSLLAGYLLLPVKTAFDFPGIPALDKTTIANVSALVSALIFAKGPVARLPSQWWVLALMALFIISPMFTVYSNPDALLFGTLSLPGLKPYDALAAAAYKAIDLIPFVLGYNMLGGNKSQHDLLRALVMAALGYTLLMLVEIRLSPQLHTWVYGFFPHSFGQQIRDGGYRPVVFLGHGLLVAIFISMALVATAYLAQRREKVLGISAWAWLVYLTGILILCRSFGALVIAMAALGIMFTARRQGIRLICTVVAIAVLAYPALRGAGIVPVQAFADQITQLNEERAASFQTRIDNEDSLLTRANLRPWFGWGGYGRNRVFDDISGKDLSITDGAWVIIVGTNGWTGYLSAFGLLCLPLLATWRRGTAISASSAALSLLLAVNLLDLIPNSSLNAITWLLSGAILGSLVKR
jgi:hypothetical protein